MVSCNQPVNNASFIGDWECTNYPSPYPGTEIAKLRFFADSTVTSEVIGKDTVFFFDKGHYRYFPENKTLVIDWANAGEHDYKIEKHKGNQFRLHNKYAGDIEEYTRIKE
jgi:hypothetical protein